MTLTDTTRAELIRHDLKEKVKQYKTWIALRRQNKIGRDYNMTKTWPRHDQDLSKTWLKHDQDKSKTGQPKTREEKIRQDNTRIDMTWQTRQDKIFADQP